MQINECSSCGVAIPREMAKCARCADPVVKPDVALLRIFLAGMLAGKYHLRDDMPGAIFRDGSACFEVKPADREGAGLAAALVHLLNNPEIMRSGGVRK